MEGGRPFYRDGGYTHIQNWPYRYGQPELVALEHNVWEDVAFYHPLWKGRLTHAIRLEHWFTSILSVIL